MSAGFKCPYCGSAKVWRKGKSPTIHGPKSRYICYDCGRSFYEPEKKRKRASKKSK